MFPNRVTAAPCERCSEANLPLVSSMPVAVVGLSELRERQNVPDGLRRPPTTTGRLAGGASSQARHYSPGAAGRHP